MTLVSNSIFSDTRLPLPTPNKRQHSKEGVGVKKEKLDVLNFECLFFFVLSVIIPDSQLQSDTCCGSKRSRCFENLEHLKWWLQISGAIEKVRYCVQFRIRNGNQHMRPYVSSHAHNIFFRKHLDFVPKIKTCANQVFRKVRFFYF